MKYFRLVFKSFAFILMVSVLATAQTEKANSDKIGEIASVDSELFKNSKNGIKELVDANKKLEDEFIRLADELRKLFEKYNILGKELEEIAKFVEPPRNITTEVLKNKIAELKSTESEIEKKQSEGKTNYEKRYSETVEIVNKKIAEALKEFAKINNYTIVLDGSEENSSAIIQGEIIDVTKEFIQFYNKRFANQKSQ